MQDIILRKIDNIVEKSGEKLLHIPASNDGMYFDNMDGCLALNHIYSSNQAFITGMAMQAYLATKNKKYLDWCHNFYEEYQEKVSDQKYDTSQDTGMLYSLYAVALYKITGDERMKRIGLMAADEVARRYIPNVGYIKAWGRVDCHYPEYVDAETEDDPFYNENKGLMVIETMMNLPLLFWATSVTKHPFYRRIAESHISTASKYLIRKDYSTAHGYRFNESTGVAYCEENYLGYAKGSHWARGGAMAIYGYVLAYRYVGGAYMQTALNLLNCFIDRCNGELPTWDFQSPDKTIDTTAAAIILSAIHEMQKYRDIESANEFEKLISDKLLKFVDGDMSMDGILREQNGKHQYGVMGDYFLTEAFLGKHHISLW